MRLMILLCLSCSMIFSSVGCSCGSDDYGDRKIINFGCYEGGWGREWLDSAIVEFEKMYPEYKVIVDYNKEGYTGSNILSKIDTIPQDIYYTSMNLYDYLDRDALLDITDVVTTPLNQYLSDSAVAFTEEKTIESKMWKDMKDYETSKDGKYYAIPFGGGLWSLSYDRDLFDAKNLFIAKNGIGNWCNLDGDLSVGLDGIEGTYDDGLPTTYDEFTVLLDRMTNIVGVIPFTWSNINGYTQHFAQAFAVAQDGADVFNAFKKMDGTNVNIVGQGSVSITKENAYKLSNTIGKYDALRFAYDVIHYGHYYSKSGSGSMDHLNAQRVYLQSVDVAKTSSANKPIAFFIDGGHWYNEAKDTLDEMASSSDDYKNRQIAVMPFPLFDNATATKATQFISSPASCICIRKNAKEPDGCKKLLAFLNSDEALILSTKTCGVIRFMDYELDEATLSQMPYYYQSMWKAGKAADICYNLCDNSLIYKNYSYFDEGGWEWTCVTSDNKNIYNPLNDFKNDSSLEVEHFFSALYTAQEKQWDKLSK